MKSSLAVLLAVVLGLWSASDARAASTKTIADCLSDYPKRPEKCLSVIAEPCIDTPTWEAQRACTADLRRVWAGLGSETQQQGQHTHVSDLERTPLPPRHFDSDACLREGERIFSVERKSRRIQRSACAALASATIWNLYVHRDTEIRTMAKKFGKDVETLQTCTARAAETGERYACIGALSSSCPMTDVENCPYEYEVLVWQQISDRSWDAFKPLSTIEVLQRGLVKRPPRRCSQGDLPCVLSGNTFVAQKAVEAFLAKERFRLGVSD